MTMTGKKSRHASYVLATSIALLASSMAIAEIPEISDPNGWLATGTETPGAFPETVTATNMNVHPIPGSTPDGAGSNDLKVSFPAGGPIAWTDVRHNEGDFALAMGPFDPNDPSYYPPDVYQEWKPQADGEPWSNASLSWRVNIEQGALLATVRHNGVDNQDTVSGSPLGITHGVANYIIGHSQGVAFRMNTGELQNGGSNSSDLIMGIAGYDNGASEASFNIGSAFFPYAEGWLGAWVNSDSPGNQATYAAKAEGVPDSAVQWNADSSARVVLPGVNSASDGMLFIAPANSSSSTNIAAGAPRDGGWDVAVREDDDFELTGTSLATGQSDFQFLYTPYDAANLIGGHVNGSNGSMINSSGDDHFTLTRNDAGAYAVSLFTDGQQTTKMTEDDGMLILSVASHVANSNPPLADRSFLSYEYDTQSGDFIIQSREVFETNSSNSDNIYGDWLKLRDSDFYFAWVDFNNPLSLGSVENADFDGDGDVDGTDFLAWQSGNGTTSGAVLADGDANGDGVVDGSDLSIWQGQFGNLPATVATAVPEPTSLALLGLMFLGEIVVCRRRT